MTDARDDLTIVVHDSKGGSTFGTGTAQGNAYEALRTLSDDPAAVERLRATIERELQRRWRRFRNS